MIWVFQNVLSRPYPEVCHVSQCPFPGQESFHTPGMTWFPPAAQQEQILNGFRGCENLHGLVIPFFIRRNKGSPTFSSSRLTAAMLEEGILNLYYLVLELEVCKCYCKASDVQTLFHVGIFIWRPNHGQGKETSVLLFLCYIFQLEYFQAQ